jgi:hypothetical protein
VVHEKRQILRLPTPFLTDAPFTHRQPGFEWVAKQGGCSGWACAAHRQPGFEWVAKPWQLGKFA